MRRTVLLCMALMLFTLTKAQIIVKIGNVAGAEPGSVINVPVSVSGLDAGSGGIAVTAMELHISYSESYMIYDTTLNFNSTVPASQWFFGTSGNEYATNWIEPNLNALSIPDQTVLFEVAFLYLGGITSLEFATAKCEFLDASYNKIDGVQYTNGTVTPSSGSEISRWNGTGPWNTAANWSNGIPGEGTSAIVESGSLLVESNAVCKMLNINPGTALTVLPAYSLTVDSLLINDGVFLLSSDETGTGSVIVNEGVSGSGTYTLNQWVGLSGSMKHLISSPVNGTSASVFTNTLLEKYNESNSAWSQLASSETLTPGTGYRISGSSDQLLSFTGIFPVNDLTISGLSYSNASQGVSKGLNLVGNPYPSSVSWVQGDWIKTNIDHSVYVWDGYKYICWNGSIGSLSNGIIPPMQGFFVHVNASNPQLIIPANSRLHGGVQLYKATETIEDVLNLRIESTDDPDHFDETYIQIAEESTLNFDASNDAYKLFGSDDFPQIFTLTPENTELAINTQPSFQSVPVVCRISKSGNYKLTFSGIPTFKPDQALTFEDKETNSFINLRNSSSYLFASEGITETSRFFMHFYEVGVEELEQPAMTLSYNLGKLKIGLKETTAQINEVQVFDMSGRCLTVAGNIQSDDYFNIGYLLPGIYIVKVQINKIVFSQKLIVY